MSYKIVREVRTALRTGRVKLTGKAAQTDRLVFFLIADDCRDDPRHASVGMAELSDITGLRRAAISRSIGRLEAAGCIRVVQRGNRIAGSGKGRASVYEIPEDFPCTTGETSIRSNRRTTSETSTGQIGVPLGGDRCTT